MTSLHKALMSLSALTLINRITITQHLPTTVLLPPLALNHPSQLTDRGRKDTAALRG